MEYVCDIFECKKQSLSRWVDRYLLENSIKRHNRLHVSYKVKKKHVKYAIKKLKEFIFKINFIKNIIKNLL